MISFRRLSKADVTFDQAVVFPIIYERWGEKDFIFTGNCLGWID